MKKYISFSLVCLLLLTGCQAKISGKTQAEWDNFLGFPVDETHIACYVDTNGEKGRLLVTGEIRYDSVVPVVVFSVWDPQNLNEPVSDFFDLPTTDGKLGEFLTEDFNFDGYMDFAYKIERSGAESAVGTLGALGILEQDSTAYDYVDCSVWLWNEGKGQFEETSGFSFRAMPELNSERKTVCGMTNSTLGGKDCINCYRWEGNDLVCKRMILITPSQADGSQSVEICDPSEGSNSFVRVCEETAEDAMELADILERWKDLDYHGE